MKTTLRWKNWAANQCFTFSRLEKPGCEDDVDRVVKRAIADNQPVRVPGAGHSFTPLVETVGTLLDLENLRGIIAVDRDKLCFDAWAATRVFELGDVLWEHGLSLSNQGDIDTQTIMGAVATGTHGSGIRLQNFSAMLRGARFFDGRGKTIDVSNANNSELLPALQTSLGMLGVVTRVCIRATRSYSIEETIKIVPFDKLMEQWDELISDYRHFSFDWIPTDRSGQLYGLEDAPKDSCIVKLHRERASDEPPAVKATRTDRSYRIYPATFEPNFYEMEYFVPIACGPDVVRCLRKLMMSGRFDSRFPMQVRFVASDDAWLSPAHGRDSAVLSISGVPGTDYESYLRTAERLFAEHRGRPHWGKLHFSTRDQLENLYPKFTDFVALRRDLDPQGLFLNAHLGALFS